MTTDRSRGFAESPPNLPCSIQTRWHVKRSKRSCDCKPPDSNRVTCFRRMPGVQSHRSSKNKERSPNFGIKVTPCKVGQTKHGSEETSACRDEQSGLRTGQEGHCHVGKPSSTLALKASLKRVRVSSLHKLLRCQSIIVNACILEGYVFPPKNNCANIRGTYLTSLGRSRGRWRSRLLYQRNSAQTLQHIENQSGKGVPSYARYVYALCSLVCSFERPSI